MYYKTVPIFKTTQIIRPDFLHFTRLFDVIRHVSALAERAVPENVPAHERAKNADVQWTGNQQVRNFVIFKVSITFSPQLGWWRVCLVDRVKTDDYAFLMESTTIEYTTQRICEVTMVRVRAAAAPWTAPGARGWRELVSWLVTATHPALACRSARCWTARATASPWRRVSHIRYFNLNFTYLN